MGDCATLTQYEFHVDLYDVCTKKNDNAECNERQNQQDDENTQQMVE